jgi:hypothetical protein
MIGNGEMLNEEFGAGVLVVTVPAFVETVTACNFVDSSNFAEYL